MVVKSRFKIGDMVWFVSDNKVHHLKISGVEMSVDSREGTKVNYTFLHNDKELEESKVFSTKKELLESL
jgi:hypothetical protein